MISFSYVLSFLLSSSVSTRISTGNDGSRPICAQQPKGGGEREPMAMGFINNCLQDLEKIIFQVCMPIYKYMLTKAAFI